MSASVQARPASQARRDWVVRVLGIAPGGAAAPAPKPAEAGVAERWKTGKLAWSLASDAVDAQINKLADLLRNHEDPEIREIGDKGLNALTAGFKVKLMAAMKDYDSAPGDPKAAQKLRSATSDFRQHLETSEQIAVCDECPDLPMAIRATLTKGLDALDSALGRSA